MLILELHFDYIISMFKRVILPPGFIRFTLLPDIVRVTFGVD
jgi:hypothetical protein